MNKLLPVIIVLVFLSSCKSLRNIIPASDIKKVEKLVVLAEENEPRYQTLKAKAKVHVETKDINQNATLYLDVIHDTLIWGSVTYLFGIEIIRFFITPDSFVMIDKFRQQYSVYPFTEIVKITALPSLTFSNLEKLLTGGLVFSLNKQFEAKTTESGFILTRNDNSGQVSVLLNRTAPVLAGYDVTIPAKASKSQVRYSGNIKYERQNIPRNVDIKVFLDEENTLTLNYQTISFDKKITVNTSIPNGFTKIE